MATPINITGTLTSNGSSTAYDWSAKQFQDWEANVQVIGTFNGATVTLEATMDGTNWTPIDNGDFTTPLLRLMRLRYCKIRATVSSAGASTSLAVLIS